MHEFPIKMVMEVLEDQEELREYWTLQQGTTDLCEFRLLVGGATAGSVVRPVLIGDSKSHHAAAAFREDHGRQARA